MRNKDKWGFNRVNDFDFYNLIEGKVPLQSRCRLYFEEFASLPFPHSLWRTVGILFIHVPLAAVSYSISNDMHVRFVSEDLRALEREPKNPKQERGPTRTWTRAKKSSESSWVELSWESSRFRYFIRVAWLGSSWSRFLVRGPSVTGYCFPFHTLLEEIIRKSINFHGT